MGGDSLFFCIKDCYIFGIFFKLEILDRKYLVFLICVYKYFCQVVFFYGVFMFWVMESRRIMLTGGEGKEVLKFRVLRYFVLYVDWVVMESFYGKKLYVY